MWRGVVLPKTCPLDTSRESVKRQRAHAGNTQNRGGRQPGRKEQNRIQPIESLNGALSHKTKAVTEFLAAPPNVQLHYTPTYSSWLNQVEIWFSKIQRI